MLHLLSVRRPGVILSGGWQPLADAYESLMAQGVCLGDMLLCSRPMAHQLLLPRCCMILHPGGSGTTACALSMGTPQLTCPLHFDQFFWVGDTLLCLSHSQLSELPWRKYRVPSLQIGSLAVGSTHMHGNVSAHDHTAIN